MQTWRPKPKPKRLELVTSSLAEQRFAARAAGYTWPEYLALPGDPWAMRLFGEDDCKANVIALYRIESAMQAMEHDL